MKFLEEVASIFAGREDLPEMCFVFPNRRSSLFFQRYLGIAAGKPVFSPRLMTINDLFAELKPELHVVDKIELLSILHKSYLEVRPAREGEEPEPFDKFIYWGDILLGDFDDIDKYMVDTEHLLTNLKDLRDLSVTYDFLSPNQKAAIAEFCRNFGPDSVGDGESDKKRMFRQTWDILLPLYRHFRSSLEKSGKAYEGMIYRSVAEDVLAHPDGACTDKLRDRYTEIVFVGLNALNECEKKLMDAVRRCGLGDFYWDFYGAMVTDEDNRAGWFIRDNVRNYPSRHQLVDVEYGGPQHFEVISVPSAVGQTRVASGIIGGLTEGGQPEKCLETAVVLPDESLLFPMLNAIPASVGKVNVTMGYSLSASAASGFFSIVERLQTNARLRKGKPHFYHRDVVDILEHPYVANADRKERESGGSEAVAAGNAAAVKEEIVSGNRIYVEADHMSARSPLFKALFSYVGLPSGFTGYLTGLIYCIQECQEPVEREFLYYCQKAVNALDSIGLDFDQMERRTYFKLLSQYISLISIPYRGEPLSGLQIMGPLETRALDFENVIMLSVGEGVFPSRSVSPSFIPYNLRVGFGMPTYEFQDAIWAYHFYRSICRAKNIYLLYDSRTEGLQSGEESRYIKQLRYHFSVEAENKVVTYSLSAGNDAGSEMSVAKDENVMRELTERFVDGKGVFSASSLNVYIDCPLRFYYQHVKKIEEEKEVVEELDAGLFGTVFHKTMQVLYGPFTGHSVTRQDLKALHDNKAGIEKIVEDSFRDDALIPEIEGRNVILKNIIVRYVQRTLEVDMETAPFTLLGVEKKVSLEYVPAGLGRKVRLFGYIDRLDTKGGNVVRVVDYKTGSVSGKDNCSDVDAMFDLAQDKRPAIAFQLFFYSLLMTCSKSDGNGSVSSGSGSSDSSARYEECVYSLRSIFGAPPVSHPTDPQDVDRFRDRVIAVIDEIFNPSVPFQGRSENGKVCEHCDFKRLCGK